jgi:hypothetical protein
MLNLCVPRYAGRFITSMTYGKPAGDNDIQEVLQCLHRLGCSLVPGAYLVDTYPILKYVPGYLRQLKQWHTEELGLFMKMIQGIRNSSASVSVYQLVTVF